jgi:hypothetical protein
MTHGTSTVFPVGAMPPNSPRCVPWVVPRLTRHPPLRPGFRWCSGDPEWPHERSIRSLRTPGGSIGVGPAPDRRTAPRSPVPGSIQNCLGPRSRRSTVALWLFAHLVSQILLRKLNRQLPHSLDVRSERVSRPLKTSPMPPLPTCDTISLRQRRAPTAKQTFAVRRGTLPTGGRRAKRNLPNSLD